MNRITSGMVAILLVMAVVVATLFLYKRRDGGEKVSCFGKYQGYSEATYDGNERRSDYLTLSDGTRLAYDLILPTKDGIPAGEAVELVFDLLPTAYRFHRGNSIRITVAFADADNFATLFLNPPPEVRLLRDVDHASFIDLPRILSQESSPLGE
jgi:predicted acyl esterase